MQSSEGRDTLATLHALNVVALQSFFIDDGGNKCNYFMASWSFLIATEEANGKGLEHRHANAAVRRYTCAAARRHAYADCHGEK